MTTEKKPRIIKRYPNRKLYDTQNSCYITLDHIAQLIKEGEDVTIIDTKTNEDLTSITLTQIIFEQEKKKKNPLPLVTLKNIIQSGGEHLVDFFQKSIQSVSSISTVKDEAERVIDKIKDELEDGGFHLRDFLAKTTQGVDDFSKKFEDKLKSLGRITNISSLRTDFRSLRKKMGEVERKLRQVDKRK